ncbi:hypothetical protein BT69DRAFT_1317928 [Atractiella rhizophila]|nr:hypothetical protein BT69DRAFT_1317928 [Atractiella rhizophila]
MPATDDTSERNSRKRKCCLHVIWICLHRRHLADSAAPRVDLQPEPRSDKLEIPEPRLDAPDVQYKTRVPYIPRLPYGASHHKIPQTRLSRIDPVLLIMLCQLRQMHWSNQERR